MSVVHEPDPVIEVLRGMAADEDVCGELVRAARARSPELARLPEAETRSHVVALVRAAGAWFTEPPFLQGSSAALRTGSAGSRPETGALPVEPGVRHPRSAGARFTSDDLRQRLDEQDFAPALLLGADRAAQGVPLAAVLRGVQAALTRAAEITVDRCRAAGVPDGALLSVVLRMKEYGDAVQRHVVGGYRAAEQGPPRGTGALRARLLGQLLLGGVVPPEGELTRAGLRPDAEGRFHCVVADPADPAALPGPHTVTAVVEGHLAGLGPRPLAAEDLGPGTLAVAAPSAPPDRLRALHRLCVRALHLARERELTGLYALTEFAAEIALADQPLLADCLRRDLLGGLDPGNAFHRQLALTALTYLDHGRRLERTATALFTHPNTVRYRLARLREITAGAPNCPLTDGGSGPLDTLHWRWALATWLEVSPAPR